MAGLSASCLDCIQGRAYPDRKFVCRRGYSGGGGGAWERGGNLDLLPETKVDACSRGLTMLKSLLDNMMRNKDLKAHSTSPMELF